MAFYRECRSCVFDVKNDEIALASLAKFKNYGEDDGDWSPKNIRSKYNFAHSIFITNKLDGSYQQYRYIADEDRILGSGSQALDPVESWRLAAGYKLLSDGQKELIKDYPDYTFIFEYISPKILLLLNMMNLKKDCIYLRQGMLRMARKFLLIFLGIWLRNMILK